MKSNLFVRPNLKLILLAALGIAVLQDIISNGQSETSLLTPTWSARPADPEEELRMLMTRAENNPRAELFARISDCFKKRGDFKNAQLYLRRAELFSESEE
jgi:hypothetical protein